MRCGGWDEAARGGVGRAVSGMGIAGSKTPVKRMTILVAVRGRAERARGEREQIVIRGGAKRSYRAWWMAQAIPKRQ